MENSNNQKWYICQYENITSARTSFLAMKFDSVIGKLEVKINYYKKENLHYMTTEKISIEDWIRYKWS